MDSAIPLNESTPFHPSWLAGDDLWLSQRQIGDLFGVKTTVVADLIRHLYKTGELGKEETIRKQQVAQSEGQRRVIRELNCYNREVIMAVGWRAHSERGEQFRQWANQRIEDELQHGFHLEAAQHGGDELTLLFSDFHRGLQKLSEYDRNKLGLRNTTMLAARPLDYFEVISVVYFLRDALFPAGEAKSFGVERAGRLESLLEAVQAKAGLRDCYPSIEEKAVQLLWMVVHQHPFEDGNLRIGAYLFLWFLQRNGLLRKGDDTPRLRDSALVPLVLIVARSEETEREQVCHLVASLINRES